MHLPRQPHQLQFAVKLLLLTLRKALRSQQLQAMSTEQRSSSAADTPAVVTAAWCDVELHETSLRAQRESLAAVERVHHRLERFNTESARLFPALRGAMAEHVVQITELRGRVALLEQRVVRCRQRADALAARHGVDVASLDLRGHED
jgi:hypothetical protein